MVCIQFWRTSHLGRVADAITLYLTRNLLLAEVSIVTLCSYDPEKSPLTVLSASNKRRYADKHGYNLFFETKRLDPQRPAAWSKVRPALMVVVLTAGVMHSDSSHEKLS